MADQPKIEREEPQRTSVDEERVRSVAENEGDGFDGMDDFDDEDDETEDDQTTIP